MPERSHGKAQAESSNEETPSKGVLDISRYLPEERSRSGHRIVSRKLPYRVVPRLNRKVLFGFHVARDPLSVSTAPLRT